jgi:hypothetical protein
MEFQRMVIMQENDNYCTLSIEIYWAVLKAVNSPIL